MLFELCDLSADGRQRNIQFPACSGETPRLDSRNKDRHRFKTIHGFSYFSRGWLPKLSDYRRSQQALWVQQDLAWPGLQLFAALRTGKVRLPIGGNDED
jgi:hypothetical protein